jgi:hypothetical protein
MGTGVGRSSNTPDYSTAYFFLEGFCELGVEYLFCAVAAAEKATSSSGLASSHAANLNQGCVRMASHFAIHGHGRKNCTSGSAS